MTREDLLQMLDIAPAATPDSTDAPQGAPPAPTAPASSTALRLDSWSMRRGAEAAEGAVLGPILRNRPNAPDAAADCLAAAFEPSPQLAEHCQDETRGRYFAELLETPEYSALHAETRLDPLASELAAGHFAQGLVKLTEEEEEEEEEEETTTGRPRGRDEGGIRRKVKTLVAAGSALKNAAQDISDLRDAQNSLGGDGATDGNLPIEEVRQRFERIRHNAELRRIIELAGRYRRAAQARQRQKTLHGRDDVVGVTLGSDLASLVPSELGALVDEDLELDALRRYLERSLMQRDYRGVESKTRGPIVVVVDESGSMRGEKISTAKAFALAMAWVAKHQHRWILLVGFAGGTQGTYCAMPPERWNQSELMTWLQHFYAGGTRMDAPLVELPSKWSALGCPPGCTDIIIITDAEVAIHADMREHFNTWKAENKVKCYSLILQHEPEDLAAISDRTWRVDDLSLEQEPIQELLGI